MRELEELFDDLSPEEIFSLGEAPRITGDCPDTVTDLTLRKAGLKMKEQRTNKRRRTAVIALIAAAALGTVGAAAAGGLFHKKNVEHYLGQGAEEQLETMDAVQNAVAENGHYRVTLDTFLCDGRYGMAVFTAEGLDDLGKGYADRFEQVNVLMLDPENNEIDDMLGSYAQGIEGEAEGQSRFVATFRVNDWELGGQVLIGFDDRQLQWDDAMFLEGKELDFNSLPNNAQGIEVPLTLEQNAQAVTARSEDGSELFLSQIEFYSDDKFFEDVESLHAIAKDGSRREIALAAVSGADPENITPGWQGAFAEILDLTELSGIEVNGVEYIIE